MMTSVTLPSSSGPSSTIHGGYTTSVAPSEETSSEPDFEIPRQAPLKRCLTIPSADTCKKRRKQSTPIRISSTEIETSAPSTSNCSEGRPSSTPIDSSTIEPDVRCPVCQLYFDTSEQLQSHIITDHSQIECKKEPEDFPTTPTSRSDSLELCIPRPEIPWMSDMQNKEWVNSNMGMQFNPSNPMFMSLPQFAQSENLPRQSIRIFNPDAYCDLCNKEFCNKYFLKTHKANKHGIYTDNATSEPITNPVNIPSYTGNIKFQPSVPSVDNAPMKNEIKTPNSVINPFSEIFPNQFSNKFPKITTSKNLFNESETTNDNIPNINGFSSSSECDKAEDVQAEQSSSPRDLQTESTSYKNDPEGLYYDTSKMSPVSSRELDLSNRLRRIGVMNPKAFCEICCKEYCNKYFLRTHKMKRHGIYIPDDRDKDFKVEGMANLPWQQNIQTSPLNLIMTEQTSQDRKTTSPNDISCEICGIKFQNASLAQLHNVTLHGKMFSKDQEQSDEETKRSDQQTTGEKSLNAEAISEDLQKLQTMILQLNDLDVTKVSTTCNACNKEFENRYFLHAHMMTEHGVLLEDMTEEKTAESENSSNNNTMCDLCGKDVQSVEEMKKHILEFHSNNQSSSENMKEFGGFSTPEKSNRVMSAGPIPERRISMNVTPTSSYCEICNKELCNKYFMKTHMQRMHGIEIENGAQIGGVVCDICNKELCSKYFLRVHKHNTHGIVEYGTSLLQPRKSEGEPAPSIMLPEPDAALKPTDLADLSHRYFTHFTEVCTICSRRFRSTKWLKAHLLSDHGQAGAEKWSELEQQLQQTIGQSKPSGSMVKVERASPTLKIPNGGQENQSNVGIQNVLSSFFGVDDSNAKNYQCSFCTFTTPLLPLLFVHERSHSINSSSGDGVPLKCPVCPQSFLQAELLQHHMFTQHPFLPLPPFFNGNNNSQGETSKEPSEADEETKGGDEELNKVQPQQAQIQVKNKSKLKVQVKQVEVSSEIGQSLKDVAKKAQLPATYALPQSQAVSSEGAGGPGSSQKEGGADSGCSGGVSSSSSSSSPGYVMQAFLLEESVVAERRVVPAVVFLPVLQKQPAPLSVTFTLTPA